MFEFTEDCRIGISSIDEEHEQLFTILNEAILRSREPDCNLPYVIKEMLNQLKEYAVSHFANEESYMEKNGDPELARQKREHKAFTQKIEDYMSLEVPEKDCAAFMNDMISYLVKWLYAHILSSDLMIGKMVKQSANSRENVFEFTKEFETGIELIDEEHKKLFAIIKDTNDVIHADFLSDKYDEIIRLLSELKEYTEVHFADEERYMESIQYAGLAAQKRAHQAFIERLVEIDYEDISEIDNNQQGYLVELIAFLLEWLTNHILKMDKLIGK